MTVPHQTDRADLLWRIHWHFAESKLASLCLDAGWEISLCFSRNIWLILGCGPQSLGSNPSAAGKVLTPAPFPSTKTSSTTSIPEASLPLLALDSTNFSIPAAFCTLMWFSFLQFLKYPTGLFNILIIFSFWILAFMLLQNITIVKVWNQRLC